MFSWGSIDRCYWGKFLLCTLPKVPGNLGFSNVFLSCGPLSAVTFRKVISPVLHPHTHVLIGNQLNTQWRILWKSLEFSICVVLFSLIIYPVNSICCGSLDSVPYPQLFASTELNLGSSSLTCSLKTLSRDLYLNCLESSYLKTVATYIFFFSCFWYSWYLAFNTMLGTVIIEWIIL